jgi:hypothetical protein
MLVQNIQQNYVTTTQALFNTSIAMDISNCPKKVPLGLNLFYQELLR